MNLLKIKNMPEKIAIDKIIKKSRVHFYKPIQIAEILFRNRTANLALTGLEVYRNVSKRWRDEVSRLLVGRVSTSSQKFQDNLFDANAMPHDTLVKLAEYNKKNGGVAEAYVYRSLERKLLSVHQIHQYIQEHDPADFSLRELLGLLTRSPGLKRSIDKAYEIAVYALFATIVRELQVSVKVSIENREQEIMQDFQDFLKSVLGFKKGETSVTFLANLYRGGVTNAADRGLDMISNFGPAVQVKHLTLTPELVEDIVEGIAAERIVIVCTTSEEEVIKNLLAQVGLSSRVQGVVTLDDLDNWYKQCLGPKYRAKLGAFLLKDLEREFSNEFPTCEEIEPFIKGRGYDKITLPRGWEIKDI